MGGNCIFSVTVFGPSREKKNNEKEETITTRVSVYKRKFIRGTKK